MPFSKIIGKGEVAGMQFVTIASLYFNFDEWCSLQVMTPSCWHLRDFKFLSSAIHKSSNSRFYSEDQFNRRRAYRTFHIPS